MNDFSPHRFVLRQLPVATRLVIAVFLVAVGLGYFSALVQLHFQHANSGNFLPGAAETIDVYYGKPMMCQLQRVLTADESKPFNGGGSMRPALTTRSAGWNGTIHRMKKKPDFKERLQHLRDEREGERLALIDWIQKGASKEDYDNDSHLLPETLANQPVTKDFLVMKDDGETPVQPRRVKIKSMIDNRCVRCHGPGKGGTPAKFPLDTYENVRVYCDKEISGAISLTKLAQTTHVHLLGFAMLFGLTGLAFSLTSYPGWVRSLFGPWTLVAQVVDISCWWLGRNDPAIAGAIMVTGSLVAVGLLIQIVGCLFNLFGKTGKTIVLLLMLSAAAGAVVAKWDIIDPYLRRERLSPEIRNIDSKTEAPPRLLPDQRAAGQRTHRPAPNPG